MKGLDINMKKNDTSVRGTILREVIAHFTSTNILGTMIKNGELRKKVVEPAWKCPEGYTMEQIDLDFFTMEWFQKERNIDEALEFEIDELAIKEYEEDTCKKKDRFVVLQLHGGGYIGAMKNAYRSFALLYSDAGKGIPVLTIDYRVAPENPFPAALDDAFTAYQWLLTEGFLPKQIIVAGDSAGGGLAMALCHKLKDEKIELPCGLIAMSPWTDLTASGSSYQDNFDLDPLFGKTEESLLFSKDYIGENDPTNPYISPLFGDFTGFPPMLLQVGDYEMLLSDTLMVAQKAKSQGVKVRKSVYKGMFHVFQMAMLLLPESRKAWVEVAHFIERIKEDNQEEK